MPAVNPEILIWARTSAGLSLADAAKGVLNEVRGKTGAERLEELESGTGEPSRSLLKKMAKKYNRPIITFYLKSPPEQSDRGQDFRTLPEPVDDKLDANLNTLIRRVKASQEIVKDLLLDDEIEELDFIGSAKIQDKPENVASTIISTLEFDIKQFRAYRNVTTAFEYLRERVQNTGIFVILTHNLGSHHTDIPVEIFRGFALSDNIAPFIVINDSDARTAWSFTLLHELAHLWLGTTGISGDIKTQGSNEIEKFCNQVAALILLDREDIKELRDMNLTDFEEAVKNVSKFAEEKNISRSMVAYTLLLNGKISNEFWQNLTKQFHTEWRSQKRREKEGRSGGGPDYYTVRRNKLGSELTSLANRAISSGNLTPSKASIVLLGVKPGNVHELLSNTRPKGKG